MSEIHIIVDGVPVSVPEGTNVVDAARTVGIAIPVFCYHPRMNPVGMCRMCLVSISLPRIDRATGKPIFDDAGKPVIARMPKLQTGCTTLVSEGMVVDTQSEEVRLAQKGILEFLLTSHPLDCPVCDKGGECPLQNLTMGWGPGQSRFDYADKVHFQKPIPLGDLIYLDRERCILCGRCVRFEDELADDPVLGYSSRGRNWHIISKSDPPFDSKFSGNTTDICPVGALTTSDFRFQARVWEIVSIPAICTHCPVGCNITLDMRHQQIKRVMPRENAAVNDIWICDKGRFGQHFVESSERLETPLIRRGEKLEPASWEEALHLVAEKFSALQRAHGVQTLAGLAGERLSNEDLYFFQKLFREVLHSNNLDHRVGMPGEAEHDTIGATLGVGRGTNLLELGKGTSVLVIGADPEEEAPVYLLRLRGIAARGGELMVANARPTKLDRSASMRLRYRPGSEIRVVRALLSILLEEADTSQAAQRATDLNELRAALGSNPIAAATDAAGVSEDELRTIARKFAGAEHGIIVYGADALAAGPPLTHALGSLLIVTGKYGKANNGLIALLPYGNSRGALDMGVCHDMGPGYRPVAAPGLPAREMWPAVAEKRILGMYMMGIDPAALYPAAQKALESLDFLVVQDMFLTETAKLADVVLPAVSFAERDGTYTNAERRVQRSRQARPAYGQSRPDWMIIQGIAQEMLRGLQPAAAPVAAEQALHAGSQGAAIAVPSLAVANPPAGWDYLTTAEVAGEIAREVPGYQGITHTRLASTGMAGSWGRQTNEAIYYDGTNYENTEGVGLQYPSPAEEANFRFSLKPLPFELATSDAQYPFTLLIQKLLYDSDPLLRNSRLLNHVPAPYVGIHPADAQQLAIGQGTQVHIASAAGSLELPARILADLPRGSVLIPAHLAGAPLAALQTGALTRVRISRKEG